VRLEGLGQLKNPFIVRGLGRKCFPALKVPRQYPLVLSTKIRLREGKVVGSEEGKGLGSGWILL
jgi:hypothetical protein